MIKEILISKQIIKILISADYADNSKFLIMYTEHRSAMIGLPLRRKSGLCTVSIKIIKQEFTF